MGRVNRRQGPGLPKVDRRLLASRNLLGGRHAAEVESVGTATTGADGNYSLSVTPTDAMETEAEANDGWLNFDIGTIADEVGKAATTTISRRLVEGRWTTTQS